MLTCGRMRFSACLSAVRHLLALICLGIGGLCSLSTAANTGHPSSGFYEVLVNGVAQAGFALLVLDDPLHPAMANKDFLALGFAKHVPPFVQEGVALVPLDGHEGMTVAIDTQHLRVSLNVAPDWYAPTRLNLKAMQAGQPLPAPVGALLNYTLQASHGGGAATALGSTQMLSWFGPAGLLELTTALRSVDSSQSALGPSAEKKFIRLGTTFLRDDPEHLTTWSVGDAVLQAGTGVPSVRYGGITWQSNFGLNPAFSTLEIPTLFDSARLPSTLEFFLNDRRVGAPVTVAPGPFEITGLPTVGVNGMVNVLIRDALNNERLIAVPYLHTASLYRQGLHGFSYTAAWLRPELDRYATPFLASSHRWGITRQWTLDAGAALSARQSSAGAGATTVLFGDVIGNLNLALSHAPSGAGQRLGASAQWQDSRASMGASYSRASSGFELLGDTTQAANRPRDELRLFAARALGRSLGSVSVSLGSLSDWSGHTRAISSIGWSKSVGSANVSLGAVHTAGNTLLQFMVSLPLERRAFWSASVQKQGQGLSARTDYATAPLTGKGLAWRLGLAANDAAGTPERTRVSAGMDMRSDLGEQGLDVVSSANGASWRARTAGSVGLLAGHGFYGPPIHGGFALVSTGDAPDIPVYRWNLPVAVSDSRGMALVTTLSPYQKNLLAIKPEDVPLQYRVASHEITAIPRGRGGVLVDFSVVRERPALVVLVLPDGRPVPVGASVHVQSSGETAPVGLRGEVYLQNLPAQAELTVRLQGKSCPVSVAHPAGHDPQPRLGPWLCVWRETP